MPCIGNERVAERFIQSPELHYHSYCRTKNKFPQEHCVNLGVRERGLFQNIPNKINSLSCDRGLSLWYILHNNVKALSPVPQQWQNLLMCLILLWANCWRKNLIELNKGLHGVTQQLNGNMSEIPLYTCKIEYSCSITRPTVSSPHSEWSQLWKLQVSSSHTPCSFSPLCYFLYSLSLSLQSSVLHYLDFGCTNPGDCVSPLFCFLSLTPTVFALGLD